MSMSMPDKSVSRNGPERMATVLSVLGILNASSSSEYDRSMNEILRILGEFESVDRSYALSLKP